MFLRVSYSLYQNYFLVIGEKIVFFLRTSLWIIVCFFGSKSDLWVDKKKNEAEKNDFIRYAK